jgi:hypothetical protein
VRPCRAYSSFGRMTLSITWMTPLVAAMSVFTIFAPSTLTPPSRDSIVSVSPLTAFAELVLTEGSRALHGVCADRRGLKCLRKRLERPGRHRGIDDVLVRAMHVFTLVHIYFLYSKITLNRKVM